MKVVLEINYCLKYNLQQTLLFVKILKSPLKKWLAYTHLHFRLKIVNIFNHHYNTIYERKINNVHDHLK